MSKGKNPTLEEIQTKNEPFYLIDKGEILNGIRLSSKNAKSLYDSATKVKAVIGNPGVANSLLILAAEESIKAFVLVAVLVNVPLTFQIGEIFSKHTVKHARGEEVNQIVEMMSILLSVFPLKKNKVNRSFIGIVKNVVNLSNKEEWWRKANLDKNSGLYVDYRGNQFVSPLNFNEDDYISSEKAVNQYVKLMEIVSNMSDKDFEPIIQFAKLRII